MFEVHVLIAFMSVSFTSRKTAFHSWLDTFSIPPRYLVSCRASKAFSYRNLDTSSTPGGSIEILSVWSIPSRHHVDRSSFLCWMSCLVPRYLLDTSAVEGIFSRHLPRQHLDTSRHLCCRDLLEILFKPRSRFLSHFLDLSSICPRRFNFQSSFPQPNLDPSWFLALSCFKSLGMILLSFVFHAFHDLKLRFLGFSLKTLGFSKSLSFYWNFGLGFQ